MAETVKITCHPQYSLEIEKYKEISDFVDGDLARVNGYLVEYDSELGPSAEAQAALTSRRRRLTNDNECAPPLHVHIGHMAQPITFGELSSNPQMSAILADVTGYEMPAQDAFAELLSLYLQHGKCAVLVDSEQSIGKSKKEAIDSAERSYQVIYEAQHIIYWQVFRKGPRKGQIAEIVLVDEPERVEGSDYVEKLVRFFFAGGEKAGPGEKFLKQELKAKDKIALKGLYTFNSATDEKEFEVVGETVVGSFDYIPVVLIGRGLKDSWFRDVASQNKFLMNNYSVLDNVLWYQGYQRSLATGCTPDQIKSLAENQMVCIDNENANVHTIEAGSPDGLFKRIEKREARLRRIAMREFNRVVGEDSKQESSASSKAMDSKTRKESYNKILDMFTGKLTRIYQYHAAYEGYKGEIAISIARDFGLDDPESEEASRGMLFSRAERLGVLPVQQQILKQGVQEMRIIPANDETEQETRQALMEAIDAAKDPLDQIREASKQFGNRNGVANAQAA